MRILHYNNVDFSIDANGEITRSSSWLVMPDDNTEINTGWVDLRAQAEQWAGEVGDPWRLPTSNSTNYTEDTDYITREISFKSQSRYVYEVVFAGSRKHLTAKMNGGISESIDNNGERVKTATWLVHAESLAGWLPQIGDVLDWAGNDYICENIQLQEHTGDEWEIKITARDTSVMMIGQPSYSHNDNHEKTCRAKWRIGLDSYAGFIAENSINSEASGWAGDAYYISDIQATPYGKIAYYVSLEAKFVESRLLNVRRNENFDGYDTNGNIKKITSWTAEWRVPKSELANFTNRVGAPANDWAESGATITRVDPVRINDLLYEVTVEAKELKNSSSYAMEYSTDDRSSLGNRKDVESRETDYILSASQCGWFKNSQGQYEEIPEWDAATLCPFSTSAPLPQELIGAHLKCVQVQEAKFLRGRSRTHVAMNVNWSTSARTLEKVTGVNGSWLKQSFETEEVFDNEGKRWTKVIRSYLHAPANMTWNGYYGGH